MTPAINNYSTRTATALNNLCSKYEIAYFVSYSSRYKTKSAKKKQSFMSWSQRKTDAKWHQDWLPSNYSKNDQESEDNVQQPPFWNYRCTRHSTDSTPPHGPGPQPSDEVTPVAKSLLGNLKDGSLLCTLCSFACTRISSGFGKNVCSTAEKLKKKFFFNSGSQFLCREHPYRRIVFHKVSTLDGGQ